VAARLLYPKAIAETYSVREMALIIETFRENIQRKPYEDLPM
jgi:hypothetical protein